MRPGISRFALLGAATAVLALIRPANQVVPPRRAATAAPRGALARAALTDRRVRRGRRRPARRRGRRSTSVRYDDFAVARGGQARACRSSGRSPRPHRPAGERSRVADARRRRRAKSPREGAVPVVRGRPRAVLRRGKPAEHEDLISLSDRLWGWDSDYEHPGRGGVGRRSRTQVGIRPRCARRLLEGALAAALRGPDGTRVDRGSATRRAGAAGRAPARCPTPTEGEPIPSEYQSAQISTPDSSIREVWTSPTEHHVVFDDPAKAAQLDGQRPTGRRALRRVPRPLVEPVARPADGPLVEALPAALAVAPRGSRRRRMAAAAELVGDARAGPRRPRDAARDRDGRLGGARLRRPRRSRVRPLRRRRPARREDGRSEGAASTTSSASSSAFRTSR